MRDRRIRLALLVLLLASPVLAQERIRFGVLGLFHPHELELEPAGTEAVTVTGGRDHFVLNGEPNHRRLLLRAAGNRVFVRDSASAAWNATARDGSDARFRLVVPGRFHRAYEGLLTVTADRGELIAVIAINREDAVSAIVAAEMGSAAPLEALKAQAVVTRSFLSAGSRHRDFDFCDTTHCQYLRSPDDIGPRVRQAAMATRGEVLEWRQKPLAALYSSRCGGKTMDLREAGMDPGDGYPYYAVKCAWCRSHPVAWRTRIVSPVPLPEPGNEPARIAHAREWGWSALPGTQFTVHRDGSGVTVDGHSVGHSLGLCQMGAIGMAAAGQSYRSILAHYYPNVELTVLR